MRTGSQVAQALHCKVLALGPGEFLQAHCSGVTLAQCLKEVVTNLAALTSPFIASSLIHDHNSREEGEIHIHHNRAANLTLTTQLKQQPTACHSAMTIKQHLLLLNDHTTGWS